MKACCYMHLLMSSSMPNSRWHHSSKLMQQWFMKFYASLLDLVCRLNKSADFFIRSLSTTTTTTSMESSIVSTSTNITATMLVVVVNVGCPIGQMAERMTTKPNSMTCQVVTSSLLWCSDCGMAAFSPAWLNAFWRPTFEMSPLILATLSSVGSQFAERGLRTTNYTILIRMRIYVTAVGAALVRVQAR